MSPEDGGASCEIEQFSNPSFITTGGALCKDPTARKNNDHKWYKDGFDKMKVFKITVSHKKL